MKKQIISLLTIIFSLISFHIQSSEQNWKPAQDGDKIILIRHAKAPGGGDPEGFKIDDCKTQRNLNEIGINQSKKIGKLVCYQDWHMAPLVEGWHHMCLNGQEAGRQPSPLGEESTGTKQSRLPSIQNTILHGFLH